MGKTYSKNKVNPLSLLQLSLENKKLKKKCEKLESLINQLKEDNDFECSVCYSNDASNKKNIRCKHPLCKRCFNLIPDKRCPLCRKKMMVTNKYIIRRTIYQ